MKDAFHTFEPHFTAHKSKRNAEIEFRLGRKGNGIFDTNVGEPVFRKLLRALEKYKGWESVEVEEYDVYYGSNNIRTTVYPDGTENSIVKARVENIDYNSSDLPFDIRMGISTENPVNVPDGMEYEMTRHKERTSFVRKNLRIDMTVVSGDPEDKDCEDESEYQIEFEIMKLSKVKNRNDLYNHIYKIKDLLECL